MRPEKDELNTPPTPEHPVVWHFRESLTDHVDNLDAEYTTNRDDLWECMIKISLRFSSGYKKNLWDVLTEKITDDDRLNEITDWCMQDCVDLIDPEVGAYHDVFSCTLDALSRGLEHGSPHAWMNITKYCVNELEVCCG